MYQMTSIKEVDRAIKKRAKSQRLKKSFDALLKPEPKSDRKNSSEVKMYDSYNNIKLKKDKERQSHKHDDIKTKSKAPKTKLKEQKSMTNDDLKNSISQDMKTTVVYKTEVAAKEKIIL